MRIGLFISTALAVVGGYIPPAPPTYDYLITDLASLQAFHPDTLNIGGVVGVDNIASASPTEFVVAIAPGIYTNGINGAVLLPSSQPTSTKKVHFTAQNPANMPVIDQIFLRNWAVAPKFTNLWLCCKTWAAFYPAGTGTITQQRSQNVRGAISSYDQGGRPPEISDCIIGGSYRGDHTFIFDWTDVLIGPALYRNRYPECANILGTLASGAFTGLSVASRTDGGITTVNDYVGDNMTGYYSTGNMIPDGVYQLSAVNFGVSAGTGFVGWMRVTNQRIVKVWINDASEPGYPGNAGTNYTQAAVYWDGKVDMNSWLPSGGIRRYGGNSFGNGDMYIQRNTFLNNLYTDIRSPLDGANSTLYVLDNITATYSDTLITGSASVSNCTVVVEGNYFGHAGFHPNDPGSPHSDGNQLDQGHNAYDRPFRSRIGANVFASEGKRSAATGVINTGYDGDDNPVDNPFATTNGSSLVTVTHTAHGYSTGRKVKFTGAATVAGLDMNAVWTITVTGTNTYTFNHTGTANATVAAGGGTSVRSNNIWGMQAEIAGNLFLGEQQGNNLDLGQTTSAAIVYNTVARWDYTNTDKNAPPSGSIAGIRINEIFSSTQVRGNIAESINVSLGAEKGDIGGNTALGQLGAGAGGVLYTDAFVDPGGKPMTWADAFAKFASKGAYANFGATAPGIVNQTTRRVNWTALAPFVKFARVVNQPVNTPVSTGWIKIVFGPATGTITCTGTGMTFKIADDYEGTGAGSAVTSYTGAVSGKWINVTYAGTPTGLLTSTATVTIAGTAFTWDVTTASVLAYTLADNQGSAYNTITLPNMTGTTAERFVFAFVGVLDAFVATSALCRSTVGSNGMNLSWTTSNVLSTTLNNGATINKKTNAGIPLSSLITMVVLVDLTQTVQSERFKVSINGGAPVAMNVANDSGTGSSVDLNTAFSTAYRLFANVAGTAPMDMKVGMYYADWGNSPASGGNMSMPPTAAGDDLTALFNMFQRDRLEISTWPMGHQPKVCIFGDWTTGATNKGTTGTVATTGTYI